MEQLADLAVYSERVLTIFDDPRHARVPEDADLLGEALSRPRNAHVRLHLRTAANAVEAAGFEALGCPHLIAAAELVCGDLEGRDPAALADYDAAFLADALPLPAEKLDLRIMLEDAVRDAVRRTARGG